MSETNNANGIDPVALLAAIVESSDDAIISRNLRGVVTSWNKSAERLYGYSASEVVGRPMADFLIPAHKTQEGKRLLEWIGQGNRTEHFDTVHRCRDGKILDVSVTLSPVHHDGNVVGASMICRDISWQVRRAENLQAVITDLESFTYDEWPGIRGPLRVMKGFIEVVLDDYGATLPGDSRELLQRASKAADRLAAHIEEKAGLADEVSTDPGARFRHPRRRPGDGETPQ